MKNKKSFLDRIWKSKFLEDDFKVFKEHIKKNRQKNQREKSFFNPEHNHLSCPFGLKDMDKAIKEISSAIENQEKIMIYGDFDADGVTSTVILVDGLQKLGAKVSYRIPDREKDSHGLKKYILDEIKETGTTLIISCDCGINDKEEVDYVTDLGLKIIISDHHKPRKENFPDKAVAVINPQRHDCKYPEKNLSGAGVAFKIIMALYEEILGEKPPQKWINRYLEIATIGQIADCMPLTGEIRTMTQLGLEALKNSQWENLKYFFKEENFEQITTETIGFYIAPRINAASRVGNVMHAVQFFLSQKNISEKLEYLNFLNEQRKILTEEALFQAEKIAELENEVLWIHLPEVKTGILGLVASKFVEKFQKPTIVSNSEKNFIHASIRSPEGCDLMQILKPIIPLFDRFGGHSGAAGFRMAPSKQKKLKEALKDLKSFKSQDLVLNIEGFVDPHLLDLKHLDFHEKLAPFGRKNEEPRYGLKNISFEEINFMGKNKDHIRLIFKEKNKIYNMVGFFMKHWGEQLDLEKKYDCVVELSKNSWNGNVRCQFRIIDIREA